MENIIGQILGIIATAMMFLSYQANTKHCVLIVQSAATVFTCISYLLLGASSGFVLNSVCFLRNVVYYFEKEKTPICYISASVFAVTLVVLSALSWQSWFSLLIIVALAANTVFLSLGDMQLLRKSILITSTMVIVYNFSVPSIGGIANEALAIVSSAVGIIRFTKAEGKRT